MILQIAAMIARPALSLRRFGMPRRFSMGPRSVEWHLGLLCTVFVLPILGFVGLLLWQYTGAERLRLEQQGTDLLHKVALAVERDLAVQGAVTELAARSPALQGDDVVSMTRAMGELARALDMQILLRTTTGEEVLRTGGLAGAPLIQGEREEDRLVLATRRPVASNIFSDPGSSTPLIAITAPVVRPVSGEVAYLLSFAFPARRISQVVAREGSAPGALAFVLDGNGRAVGTSRLDVVALGQEAGFLDPQAVGPAGQFAAEAPNGLHMTAQYKRLAGAGWTVVIGLEEEVLRAPMQRFLVQLLGTGLALIALSFALAFTFGRQITGAMDELQAAAAALGAGKAVAPVDTPVVQVNAVGQALQEAATAIRQGQEQQALLNRELHHRVKNNLATVQAVIGSAARTAETLEGFREALSSRLNSLAKTHDLLVGSGAGGASLIDLLRNELQPYQDGETRRVELAGPSVQLPADMALPVGMLLHELTTNAVKYGALSATGGRLRVSWALSPGNRPSLTLNWIESGGPPAREPTRKGFGSKLLDRVGQQLGGGVERTFAPEGLRVVLHAPLPEIRPAGPRLDGRTELRPMSSLPDRHTGAGSQLRQEGLGPMDECRGLEGQGARVLRKG